MLAKMQAYLSHQAEEIVVAAKEYVQAHLNVVPILVLKTRHFSPNKGSALVQVNLK